MSRITRWKPEKTKTKVVFRLQFHATHIPQSGWDKLFITFIPADSGKATAKTTKANVRNGICKWADPIYETTRLFQDLRTKHFDEKLYKFVVSMGSSRSSLLGEATINLADYADALKPSSVALPLQGCDSGSILHVTVQLLTSKTGFREFEQQRELRERGLLTTSDHNSRNESATGRLLSSGVTISDHAENSRVNLNPQLRDHSLHEDDAAQNEDHVGSPIAFDGSSNTSGSLYADKQDAPSPHEIDSQNSDQKYPPTHGTRDWINSWGSEFSGDNDLAIAYEESRLRGSLDSAETSLHELKLELSSLQSHADELGMEAQKFAQQLAAEMASGENLAREVAILKTECSKFKREIEVLKDNNNKLRSQNNGRKSAANVEEPIYQDLQLRWLKGLLLVEDKLRELQNKACFGFDDTDLRVLGSDLESMLMMLKDLKQGTGQVISSLNFVALEGGPALKELVVDSNSHDSEELKSRFGLGTDLYQPESMLHHSVDITNSMKNRIDELVRELEESKAEKESLVQKMGQMECYYEAFIQELEGNQRHMLGELQNLRSEHSACLYAVSSTNAEMERMRQDMNDKLILRTEEKHELNVLNKELERRAVTAEAALKRARLNYSIAVRQLQKDLELLSSQVSAMYEANQNLIKEAIQDPEEVNPAGTYKSRALLQKKQNLGGEALLDDLRRSLSLQEELYRKVEEEVRDMHYENMCLDIFSKILRETLLEAVSDMGVKMNEKDEMTKQLGFYKKSNDVLMLKLQNTLDEVESLKKEQIALSAKFYDMTQWNENLEASLRSVTDENGCLMQKITELDNLLRKETGESSDLRNGNIALQEKLVNLTHELHEVECVKKNLEMRVGNLQEEMQGLLKAYDEKVSRLTEEKEVLAKEREMTHASFSTSESAKENLEKVVSDLQEKMQALLVCHDERLSQLMKEVEGVTKERDTAHALLSALEPAKENLEKIVGDLLQKLHILLINHDKNFDVASLDLFALVSQLGEFQETAQQKISRLMGEIEALATERDEARASLGLSESAKENLQKLVDNLEEKLRDLLVVHHKNCGGTSRDLFDVVSQIGEAQRGVYQRISDLIGEAEVLARERDVAQASLSSSESERDNLKNVVSVLQEKLRSLIISYDENVNGSSLDLINALSQLEEFQNTARRRISELMEENKVLTRDRDSANASLSQSESDICAVKERFECDLRDMLSKINTSDTLVRKLQSELEIIAGRLNSCLKDEEIYEEQQKVLIADLDRFKAELEQLILKNADLAENTLSLQNLGEELEKSKLAVEEYAEDNRSLMESLREETEESARLVSELTKLRESLLCLNEELQRERGCREEMENTITNLAAQLNETRSRLPDFDQQHSELVQLRQLVSNLESEKLRLCNLLLQKEESIKVASQESFSIKHLEDQLFEMQGHLIASDAQLVYTGAQYWTLIEDVVQQLKLSERNLADLNDKHLNMESRLNHSLANEVHLIEENAELSRNLESLRTELEAAAAQNRVLIGNNDALALELEEHRRRNEVLDGIILEGNRKHEFQIERLMQRLASSEEEIDSLIVSNEELQVELLVLKDKLCEHCRELTLMEKEYKELSERLSAQVLKTVEFKNLSIHLRELKETAESEWAKARQKKEAESPPFAVQESLRIAFIKEQYESKVQELKQQLSISKKHSEEMLLKLQDAVDESENRKRIEASNLRRNEELSMKILDLESELQEIVTDKREKAKVYDCMKAEMECSLISLECCKEEKQKLEASLQECCEEKSKIEAELAQVKELLESSKTQSGISEISLAETANSERRSVDRAFSLYGDEADSCSSPIAEMHTKQDSVSRGENGVQSLALVNGENFLDSDAKDLALVNDHFKVQGLRSSMENLNKELEKMKNENWLLPYEDHQFDPKFPDLERELMQLDKANQELGSIYPSFNDLGGGGNALERVLALEIELAGALQAKKSFQSSFLRQHSDEAAIYKSFRDINELIRDMLELKGRYSAVESELKEMHGRYSQLSLQFAEVEGERQKLVMTLKCVRPSKKALSLNRSPSASLGENPS
ncbi:COP1-interactive protein 1 [Punica granatum]|uniref:COP1-interactive protein 1 n=3 Tax=Punica granatum TaxID=22663 RepID=A0A6P8DKZ8_PUNGR|nr:COP1-interactive protein 1 [Punica granatum]XP_031394095.1 COP1-interactive protein 1 [Punica granatum]XP_031394096.1 COP1-interactive protein 1 [Punica granatum]